MSNTATAPAQSPSNMALIRKFFFAGEPLETVAREMHDLTPEDKQELGDLIAAELNLTR